MFLWDWALGEVMDGIIDWLYAIGIGLIGSVIGEMGNMGYELLELSYVQAIILFFSYLAWALYVVGLVVAVFEAGIEFQCGRACLKDTAMGAIKGFMAVSLFTILPVRLYKLAIDLQVLLTNGITGMAANNAIQQALNPYLSAATLSDFGSELGGLSGWTPAALLLAEIMMIYAIVKVFFSCLKRGGIMLIQIGVGSLYMFSVPRGFLDGFYTWCKQIIGLCLTTFLQGTVLTIGMLTLKPHPVLGIGMMLSSTEIPRIAGMFGLDTSMRLNVMGAVHGVQSAVNTAHTVKKMSMMGGAA